MKSGQAGPAKTATPPLNARRSLIGKTYFQIEERALAITEARCAAGIEGIPDEAQKPSGRYWAASPSWSKPKPPWISTVDICLPAQF